MSNFRYPDKPTLSTLDAISHLSEQDYIGQCKYDGWRLQMIYDDKWHIFTRTGKDIKDVPNIKMPQQLLEDINCLSVPKGSSLDAEFVGPRGHLPPSVYIFDCLRWDGSWLSRCAFEDRWKRCLSLVEQGIILGGDKEIQLAYTFEQDFLTEFNKMRDEWPDISEGIVLKRRKGMLALSRKSSVTSKDQFKCKFRN